MHNHYKILEEQLNETTLLEVISDPMGLSPKEIDSWGWNAEEKADLLEDLESGRLEVFGLLKKEKCLCCEQYKVIDSVYQIIAASATEALRSYKDCI